MHHIKINNKEKYYKMTLQRNYQKSNNSIELN
jgi:hypothetical protein